MTRRTQPLSIASPAGAVTRYRDRIWDDNRHDPYQSAGKYKEPTVCSGCQAAFHSGRWQSSGSPAGAHRALCPACRRTRDKLPAGFVTLGGAFFNAHRDELLALVHNVVDREREEHPLNRIMHIEETDEGVVITTTDIHSPQRMAEALKHAYRGSIKLQYGHDEYVVHVSWQR